MRMRNRYKLAYGYHLEFIRLNLEDSNSTTIDPDQAMLVTGTPTPLGDCDKKHQKRSSENNHHSCRNMRTLLSANIIPSSIAPFLAGAMTLLIFIVDAFTASDIAIAVLYGVVILLASFMWPRRFIIALSYLCLALTFFAYLQGHELHEFGSGFGRFLVSMAAISVTAFLALKGQDATQAVMQREQALREVDRRKNEFLAMLAHELRNPLAPISTAAQLLQNAPADRTLVQEVSEILIRQTEHLTEMVNELLDVSRVTRGIVTLRKVDTDIQQVVSDAVEQVNPAIAEKRHQLILDLTKEQIYVHGDYQRLVQIMANLLGNAVKYTPPGGRITIQVQASSQQVSIDVVDTGIGMPADLIPHVFDLFTQAERGPDRAQGGLGIGLALVKSLVELHGGKIACRSDGIGRGSRFSVSLPRIHRFESAKDQWSRSDAYPSSGQQLRILIVDDNANAARMLSLFLQSRGHAVITEHSFHKGLEAACNETPDVCLFDIGLPEHDGNELARRVRSDPRTSEALLIAVSGYDQEKDKEDAMAAGFDHYLVKPVDTEELNALLASAPLRHSRPSIND
jgi:signal transduction histidine kinase/ActR/RegA family two-component response regulator